MVDADAPHELGELAEWPAEIISLAVLGHPVAHSLSPVMHNAALANLAQGMPMLANWRYFKFDVTPEALPLALDLFWNAGFHGLNLTIPHKVDVLPHLSAIDPFAARAGAANTLQRLPGGGWKGYNTDGYGMQQAIERGFGVPLAGANVVLLGAGGAARGAAVQCLEANCQSLWIGNRTPGRLEALVNTLGDASRVQTFSLLDDTISLPENALVINATSLGLKSDDASPLYPSLITEVMKIYDMTYGCRNQLAQAAEERGAAYADGLPMLVWQGVRALEIWTGVPVPANTMMHAACKARTIPLRDA